MPMKIQSDFESLKRSLSAKLFRKQLVYSHIFTSRNPTATDISTLKRKVASYWANASGGVLIDTEISPVESGLSMAVAGVFPRENLIRLHKSCSQTWFEISHKKQRVQVKDKFDEVDDVIPSYDTTPLRNVIDQVGVELEGGWTHIRPPGMRSDGSIFTNGIPSHTTEGKAIRSSTGTSRIPVSAGEISFGPYKLNRVPWGSEETKRQPLTGIAAIVEPHFSAYGETSSSETVVMLRRDFYTLYPDVLDPTCGMHVHFSFPSPMVYSAFVDERFQPWLLRGLETWAKKKDLTFPPFYNRIYGDNRYCRKDIYEPTSQLIARTRTGVRYAAVNYCYTIHGTMEIRVLPMFLLPQQAQIAINELIRLINVWGEIKAPQPKVLPIPFIESLTD